jgi:uncharacterized membrane protein
MFALVVGILDWGNFMYSDDEDIRTIQYTSGGPDREYIMMHKLFARIVHILRISIGDFNFEATTFMDPFVNQFYWTMFIIICTITCIIFMNFIIAEVGASYTSVKDTLHYKLLQERGELINEAEDILRSRYHNSRIVKWVHLFPRYIITRELDE